MTINESNKIKNDNIFCIINKSRTVVGITYATMSYMI